MAKTLDVASTAVEFYRTEFPDRCVGAHTRNVRERIRREVANECRPVEIEPYVLDRIRRAGDKPELEFVSAGDPYKPGCQEPVFGWIPQRAVLMAMPASYWRERLVARYMLLGYRPRPHALERLRERFPAHKDATWVDFAQLFLAAREWPHFDAPQDEDDPDGAPNHFRCAVDPREDDSFLPVFVVSDPAPPGDDEPDGPPLRNIRSVLTPDMALRNHSATFQNGTTARLEIPEDVRQKADDALAASSSDDDQEPGHLTEPSEQSEPCEQPCEQECEQREHGLPSASGECEQPCEQPEPEPTSVHVTLAVSPHEVATVMSGLIETGRAVLGSGGVTIELVVRGRSVS